MINSSFRTLIQLAALTATIACSTQQGSRNELKAAGNWKQVLVCDQGSAWVDVDLNNRRHLQLVIRNRAANDHLDSMMASAGLMYVSGGSWERGYEGFQDYDYNGIGTDAGKMQKFGGSRTAVSLDRGYTRYGLSFEEHLSFRQDGSGLKVEFTRTNIEQCRQYSGRFGTCGDSGTFHIDNEYRGNWFFKDCHKVN